MLQDLAPLIIRLADEGIPLGAISRAVKIPTEDIRPILHDAMALGSIVFFPKEDWPPKQPRDSRETLSPAGMDITRTDGPPAEVMMKLSRVFGTTRLQSRVLYRLLRRHSCTKEQIHDAVEENRNNPSVPTNPKIVDVVICHLRKKLKKFELKVETIHNQGYHIDPDGQARAIALMRES